MKEKLNAWFTQFMQGRYGFDEYGRRLITITIVLFIIGIVFDLVRNFLGSWAGIASSAVSSLAIIVMVYAYFRILSKNVEKRRAENERFFSRKRAGEKRKARAAANKEYKYLKCPSCKQEMRVPRGKGKISVKCPKCGEKTVIKS